MKPLHSLIAAAVMAIGVTTASCEAHAGYLTDLWWKPDESGWGANVIQQDNIGFVTLFVYGPNGEPVWYAAPETRVVAIDGATGLPVLSGPVYRTRGAYFGGSYDASKFQATPVGTISIVPLNSNYAQFRYSIEGVTVTKVATRLTWMASPLESIGGLGYSGALSTMLRSPGNAPQVRRTQGNFTFELDADVATIRFQDAGAECTYRGPWVQAGKLGTVTGTFSCTDLRAGTFAMTEMEFTRNGFSGRISMNSTEGQQSGTFGGARR
jgi:hypothetical protein